jgi:Outer membrane protein beta-barrel domain
MRRLHLLVALVASAALSVPTGAGAQALGPQRQFLAIEPYYERLRFDIGDNLDKATFNGYGGRLWINTEPFHFIPNGSIALFMSYTPKQNITINGVTASTESTQLAYGAEYDQFLVRRPLGGIIDPFLTVGYERYRFRDTQNGEKESFNGMPVGGGVRIPFPNRFELRGDVKDLILFNTPTGLNDAKRTTHNLLLQAGLGLTF